MAFFEIRGGIPLRGSVTVSGAKNAALPIICASIMADEPCRIENLPDIEDVNRITEILSSMGAAITRPAPGVVVIDPRTIKSHSVTNEMAAKLRASYYMLGALLGKFRRAEIAQPGGCAIGQRHGLSYQRNARSRSKCAGSLRHSYRLGRQASRCGDLS